MYFKNSYNWVYHLGFKLKIPSRIHAKDLGKSSNECGEYGVG